MCPLARDCFTAMSECAKARTKVCGVCTRKGKLRGISDSVLKMIREHHFADYNFDEFPSVICMGCDRLLRFIDKAKKDKTKPKGKLPSITYDDKRAPRVTRATAGQPCSCFWCRVAAMNGFEYLKHCESIRPSPDKASQKPRTVKRCGKCLGVIARGVRHNCTKTARNKNSKELVKAFSTEGQKRHTSSLLNSFCEEEKIDKRTGTLKLNSGAKIKTINFGEKKPPSQLKVADLVKFGNENNFSDAKILKTGTLIRRAFGKHAVEKNLEKKLPKLKKEMSDYMQLMEVETVKQKKGKDNIVETVPLVSVDDFSGFCAMAMAERGLTPSETDIMIGLDDGANILKVQV